MSKKAKFTEGLKKEYCELYVTCTVDIQKAKIVNAHIYEDQLQTLIDIQLKRDPYPSPRLKIWRPG